MKKLTTFIILLLCATSLFAQAPEKFSYQAVVRNANNTIVTNAPVGVRVSILQGSADGSAVYVETHTAVTNANGLLTLEIGGGKAEQGGFAGIDWSDGPFFLKTETDPNGGGDYSITSTQQLLSVPYALYAREAANGFSGDYNDLKNKPAIPQNVGDLPNDAGYITLGDLPAQAKGAVNDAGVVQTTACGEVDLCEMASQLAELQQMRAALLPTVTTSAVGSVTENTVSCGGNVTNSGYSEVTGRGVCWGTEPTPTVVGSHTSSGSGTGDFAVQLGGLLPNTTYYVRAYATNSIGTAYGNEVSFTTAAPCAALTLPYSEDFEGYTTSTTAATGVRPDCWKLVREDVAVTDATHPQVYYKSSYAHSGNYTLRMANRCVYAMPALSENVPVSWVRMEMYVRQPNAAYQLEVGVWDDATATFERVQLINNSTTNVQRVVCDFSNYSGNGHRIAFRNVLGGGASYNYSYNYIDDITLDTVPGGVASVMPPTVNTGDVRDVTETTAACGGEVTNTGGSAIIVRGVCWGTGANPTVDGSHTTDGSGTGAFTSSISSLTPNTTYYVRAYAINSAGTAYGETVSFTTMAVDTCGTITLPYSENFDSYTTSTAASTGVRPECWKLVQEDVAVTEATQPQIYYKSSYAHSGSYTLRMANRCVYAMPALSADVQLNQVKLEMYLRQANAAYRLEVGVWDDVTRTFEQVKLINNSSTNVEYVSLDFSSYTGNGRRIAFRNVLGGGANYDYSYNYIDDIALDIRDGFPCSGTPTVTDHEGNVYATVQIGNQCWMRDNLRTTTSPSTGTYLVNNHFTNGTNVAYTYTGKMARWNNNDSATYAPMNYGLLYNWNAAVDTFNTAYGEMSVNTSYSNAVSVTFSGHRRGICPVGWHLPSDAEWNTMEATVSGSDWQTSYETTNEEEYGRGNHAGKLAGGDNWACIDSQWTVESGAPGDYGNADRNVSGFSAVPAGNCYGSSFYDAGYYAGFWSATQEVSEPALAYDRHLGCYAAGVYRSSFNKCHGFSVRCLRDELGENDSTTTVVVDEKSCPGTPTVTDHEGNVYATVQIGQQCWMRDNLRTTTSPSTGTYLIPAAGTGVTYTGKQALWYNNDSATYAPMNYGLLYNWNAAVDTFNTAYGETSVNTDYNNIVSVTFSGHRRGICPAGWHLPSDAEWTVLKDYVSSVPEYQCGGNSWSIAKALASEMEWNRYSGSCCPGDQSVTANNATGFSAVPAGCSGSSFYDAGCSGSSFYDAGYYAFFWSATQRAEYPIDACYRYLNYRYAGIDVYVDDGLDNKSSGRSVRCLRD